MLRCTAEVNTPYGLTDNIWGNLMQITVPYGCTERIFMGITKIFDQRLSHPLTTYWCIKSTRGRDFGQHKQSMSAAAKNILLLQYTNFTVQLYLQQTGRPLGSDEVCKLSGESKQRLQGTTVKLE